MTLMIGNVGAGKSYKVKELAEENDNSVVVCMNDIITMVGGGRYKYFHDKKDVYREIQATAIEAALENGNDVIIDRSNINIFARETFIDIGLKYGADIVAYDFGAGTEEHLRRRIEDSRGINPEQWKVVFQRFHKNYEPAHKDQGFSKIITVET